MGLAERRAAQQFEKNTLPQLKNRIDEAAGFDVLLDIDYTNLMREDPSRYEDLWPKMYFEPLIEAFKAICADDLGKEALKASLKKVEVTNSDQFGSNLDGAVTFADGVLRIDFRIQDVDSISYRAGGIVKRLEQVL
jgi:hypothetical protein